MLVFDIETMGLDPEKHEVTVVCTEEFNTGQKKTYNFARLEIEDDIGRNALLRTLIRDFDEADYLCAFNGVRFDLPFLKRALEIPSEIVTAWVLKTVDLLEYLRLSGMPWCSLDQLCKANGIPTKTSSGLQAIQMAMECNWTDLEAYCEHDVFMLCSLYRLASLQHPSRDSFRIDMSDHIPKNMVV